MSTGDWLIYYSPRTDMENGERGLQELRQNPGDTEQ